MAIESKKAFKGTSERCLLTFEKVLGKGMAESRANAHVAREAAQQMEMAQNMPMPNTGRSEARFRGNGVIRTDEPLQK